MSSNTNVKEWKRLSGRTYDEFKRDIKQSTIDERIIIEKYRDYCKTVHNIDIIIEDNGVDNTGEFLDVSQVRSDADFKVNGKLVEVKTIKDKLKVFRLKVASIKSYIKQNATMLLVSGWKTEEPEFTMITPKLMKHLLKTKKIEVARDWENKKIVKLTYDDFNWIILN